MGRPTPADRRRALRRQLWMEIAAIWTGVALICGGLWWWALSSSRVSQQQELMAAAVAESPSPPIVIKGNCSAGVVAGPAKDRHGGYSETMPRPAAVPSFATSGGLSSLPPEWRRHARVQGFQTLRAVGASLKERPTSLPGQRETSRAAVLRILPAKAVAESKTCANINHDRLRDAAEVALDAGVESWLWACVIVRTALGHSVEDADLAEILGAERMWQTVEYRLFLREWTRHQLSTSGAMCQRGWGSPSAKYLAAGVWGVTYSRCIAEQGCAYNPRVVIKLAGLPADTHYIDADNGERVNLGEASLHAGFDLGVESFMNEAVRLLVSSGVTPHIIIGYGTWICDDFLNVPEGTFPVTTISPEDCKRRTSSRRRKSSRSRSSNSSTTASPVSAALSLVGDKEKSSLCANILKEVGSGQQGKNLPAMSQEEVLLGMKDAYKQIAEHHKKTPRAWTNAVKALLFEVTYTIGALQRHFPTFRHNDLSWYNVRTTAPYSLGVKQRNRETNKSEGARPGEMYAPLDDKGVALTYTEYTVEGQLYRVPNYGYSVRVADWDFANSVVMPRLVNPKLTYTEESGCGQEISERNMWTDPVSVGAVSVVKRLSVAKDRVTPGPVKHFGNLTCREWATDGCSVRRLVLGGTPPREIQRVLEFCPNACQSASATVDLTFDAPPFFSAPPLADDPDYRDEEGNDCASWDKQCDVATCNGWSEEDMAVIMNKCPVSCGIMLHGPRKDAAEPTAYLVRVDGAKGIPAGVYRGNLQPGGGKGGRWTVRITVANKTGVDLKAVGPPASLHFFRRAWIKSFKLSPTKKRSSHQKHKYALMVDKLDWDPLGFVKNDVVFIGDNEAATEGYYKVDKVTMPKDHTVGVVNVDLTSTVVSKHLEKGGSSAGGFLYRAAVACTGKFYEYSHYGLTPVENRKFDLHFLFNQLADYFDDDDWRPTFPDEVVDGVRAFFAEADPDLRGWYSPLVHDYRMSDNHEYWWCNRTGTWTTDDLAIKGLLTPLQMLRTGMYESFRVKSGEPPPAGAVRIGNHSLDAPLPKELCIGTGELPRHGA